MATILLTGANRGLGLEFTRQYAANGDTVLACCRAPNKAAELLELKKTYSNIQVFALDLGKPEEIAQLATQISDPIDILLNNAGVLINDELGNLLVESLEIGYQINAIAPIKMTEAFLAHLQKGDKKMIVSLSTAMSSITQNKSGGYYSYRSSKAALNMLMKSAGIDLAPYNIKVLLLNPGWAKTRMGGSSATLEIADSVKGMRDVIENYSPEIGDVHFYRYDGKSMPW